MSLLDRLHTEIKTIFEERPHRFFTEHDIHSELSRIATEHLVKKGKLYVKTNDNHEVSRVHHEYPTPFRCYMKKYDFKVVTEEEFSELKSKGLRPRARRGRIDLVVLNLDFVSSNKLITVSGKTYENFRQDLAKQKYPALDLAMEVVYHPALDKKPHSGMMEGKVASTIQDYQKLTALTEFRFPNDVCFCKEAAMFFFSNTAYKDELEEIFRKLPENKVPCFKILCPGDMR